MSLQRYTKVDHFRYENRLFILEFFLWFFAEIKLDWKRNVLVVKVINEEDVSILTFTFLKEKNWMHFNVTLKNNRLPYQVIFELVQIKVDFFFLICVTAKGVAGSVKFISVIYSNAFRWINLSSFFSMNCKAIKKHIFLIYDLISLDGNVFTNTCNIIRFWEFWVVLEGQF